MAECQSLLDADCQLLGEWSLAQIFSHLARGIDCCYEGFDFKVNWWLRTFLGRLLKRRFLRRGMPAGIRLPSTAVRLLPGQDPEAPLEFEHLKRSLARLQREPPSQPHPVFGQMTWEEARQMMLRHAELHLSFVVPLNS